MTKPRISSRAALAEYRRAMKERHGSATTVRVLWDSGVVEGAWQGEYFRNLRVELMAPGYRPKIAVLSIDGKDGSFSVR